MGLGSGYGESARTVGATAPFGMRLMAFQVPDTVANPAGDPAKAVRFGVAAAFGCAGNGSAHAVRTGSADCSRCCFVTDDGRYVMRPAPSVGPATSVFA
ncbi:hypothetical protein, partial [Marivita sp.]|uniref:hypothetical protein n=1 Tax=Marivita sp. TaxID=2003365 RepID=UPI003F721BE2